MGINSNGTTLIDQGVFQNIGAITWDTTAKTGNFTAVKGNGYFVNTTSASITVTLPSSPSAGDVVGIADYANTADTNKIVIGRNGSNIQGTADDFDIVKEGGTIVLVYVDGTQGWKSIEEGTGFIGENFINATGGDAIVTCGNFKTHIFTGSGTFTVCSLASSSPNNNVDYLIVAGGGGGGTGGAGGGAGGAGGFRMSNSLGLPGPATSPLANPSGLPVSAQAYPITIGGGGTAGADPVPNNGGNGNPSTFSSITSTGGGFGGGYNDSQGDPGGSGGGGGDPDGPQPNAGGTGNTPPVSPSQGSNGGAGSSGTPGGDGTQAGGGGGGAAGTGTAGTFSPSHTGGPGGIGSFISDSFVGPTAPSYGTPGPVGSTRYFAGGGGGSSQCGSKGAGGSGGGGTATSGTGVAGTTNTGGGASGGASPGAGGAGGSGIIMIRYKFQ